MSLVFVCGRKKHVRTRKRARPFQPEEPGDEDLLSFRSGSQPVSVQISACSAVVVDVVTCTEKSLQTKKAKKRRHRAISENAMSGACQIPNRWKNWLRRQKEIGLDSKTESEKEHRWDKDRFYQEGLSEVKGSALLTPSITNNSEMEAQILR
uniref:Uncharacterized protein n=1 Tax=Ditylenchus dipsaci TaxID=166011 RepID=A0A915D701_9BILA